MIFIHYQLLYKDVNDTKFFITRKMLGLLAPAIIMSFCIAGCNENTIKFDNSSPVLLTLTVFLNVIYPSNSVIITCNAIDPAGDTLVYD